MALVQIKMWDQIQSLVLADDARKFSGFNGKIILKLPYEQSVIVKFISHFIHWMKPYASKLRQNPHFLMKEEWMIGFDGKLFGIQESSAIPGIHFGDKTTALFDNDNYDSDGDGISNVLERAFGGDSLKSDSESVLPRPIKSKPAGEEEKEFITFLKFNNNYNNEGIEYIVETSRDLRTWLPKDNADGAEPHGSAVDVGGGMERVVYKTKKEELTTVMTKSLSESA